MGLAPSEFYALQYCELELIIEGARERNRRAAQERRELGAWMLHWLLLPYTRPDADPITIDTLLGRKSRHKPPRRFASPVAALDAFFAARSEQEQKKHG